MVQAVLAHWCEHRDTYVSGKGASERTYMVRLVRNRLIDIARRERTEKRHALGGVVSLDEPLGDTDETRHDIVTEEIETDDDEGLRLDLESAMAGLCDREQAVCELLAEGETKSSIASRLGVSRDTVHEDIRRIRTVFCRRDLQVYI